MAECQVFKVQGDVVVWNVARKNVKTPLSPLKWYPNIGRWDDHNSSMEFLCTYVVTIALWYVKWHPSISWIIFSSFFASSRFYFIIHKYCVIIYAKNRIILRKFKDKNIPKQYILMYMTRHQMETFSALLAFCAGNSPVTGEFHAQRPVTRSFDVFFDLRLNRRLSKQSWGWWI